MATHLAKERPKEHKEVGVKDEKDLFADDTGQIPEPVDPPEDELDNEEIVQTEDEQIRAELLKKFGQAGVDEYEKQLKDMEKEPEPVVESKPESGTVKPKMKTEQLRELNRCATFILNCLEPGIRRDFETAAFDNQIDEIGVYILGILNMQYKMGDYYNPDVEIEWENNEIGYKGDLTCQYCNKPIINPKNIGQVFCSNLCAKNSKRYDTGVLRPAEKTRDVEEAREHVLRSYESTLKNLKK